MAESKFDFENCLKTTKEIDNYIIKVCANQHEFYDFICYYIKLDKNSPLFVNSTLSLILRKMIQLEYHLQVNTLDYLFKITRKIKVNSINYLIDYVTNHIDILSNNDLILCINIIDRNTNNYNLWLTEEYYIKLVKLIKSILEQNTMQSIIYQISEKLTTIDLIYRYPYFEEGESKEITSWIIQKLKSNQKDINFDNLYNRKIRKLVKSSWNYIFENTYKDSKHKSRKKKWIKEYESFVDTLSKSEEKNLIVDGMNTFYKSAESDTYINIKLLLQFIKKYDLASYENVYIVFYVKHRELLEENLKNIIQKSNENHLDINDKIKIIFSPKYKDDDLLSLYMWLSNDKNYIGTNDEFKNHVKMFHSNLYQYGLWMYFLKTKKISIRFDKNK